VLFFGSHYLVGLAGWEEALLIGAGVLLLAAELLIIPGFGVAGILGIVALGSGFFLSFLGSYPAADDIWRAGTTLLTSLLLMGVGTVVLLMLLPGLPMWSRLNLRTHLGKEPEGTPTPPKVRLPSARLGIQGMTLTPLRPAGIGLFHIPSLLVVAL
jgi:membrane-bound serine protease (ClpP class)